MVGEKYVYFRKCATVAEDDDVANGSRMYPVSAFKGMCVGTAAATGIITGAEDTLTMFFQAMGTKAGVKGEDASVGSVDGEADDIIILTVGTNGQKKVMTSIATAIASTGSFQVPVIDIFDNVLGTSVDATISDIDIIHSVYAD